MLCRGCARAFVDTQGVYCVARRQWLEVAECPYYEMLETSPEPDVRSAAIAYAQAEMARRRWPTDSKTRDAIVRLCVERVLIARGMHTVERRVTLYMTEVLAVFGHTYSVRLPERAIKDRQEMGVK